MRSHNHVLTFVQVASCIDASQGLSGQLFIDNSIFAYNGLGSGLALASSPVMVQCLIPNSCSVSVSNTVFDHNQGVDGVLHVINAGSLSLVDVAFRNNRGGALVADVVETVSIGSSEFVGIHADDWLGDGTESPGGGAVLLLGCVTIVVYRSSFVDISSLGSGGAVYIDVSSTVYVQDCSFSNCTSRSGSGGAICIMNVNSYVEIDRTSFSSCSAAISGGAVYTATSWQLQLINCYFSSCGAGLLPHDGWSTSALAQQHLVENSYQSGGGGVYATTVHLVSQCVPSVNRMIL